MYRRGADCHTAKLSEADVVLIRTLRALGLTYRAIGLKFEVSAGTVWYCVHNRSWSHIPSTGLDPCSVGLVTFVKNGGTLAGLLALTGK